MMQQQKQPPMPADEAQEYLAKLQAGKVQLGEGAGALEREAFGAMQEASKRMRDLTTQMGDNDKEIEVLKRRGEALQARLNETAGEMGGYAKLLVSAEGARRRELEAEAQAEAAEAEAKADEAQTDGKDKTPEEPIAVRPLEEPKATKPPEAPAAEVKNLETHKKASQPAREPAPTKKARNA